MFSYPTQLFSLYNQGVKKQGQGNQCKTPGVKLETQLKSQKIKKKSGKKN